MKFGVNKNTARLAGFLYLIVVVTGIFSLAYVPSKLIVWSDPAKTVQQITASESLFRLSLVSSAICYVAFLLLPFVLYKLLNSINEIAAKLMIILAAVSVPISMLNLQNKYAVLTLLNGKNYLSIFSEQQLQIQIMQLLENYDNGILILQIFWGLWLFPFGYLVYKSGFLPRILGILLMLGCCGYLISFAGNTLMQNYGETLISRFDTMPATFGEIGSCLWLLIRGINEKAVLKD
ncbi:MAG: DUF4386 domain-containing protein [Pyrinomonadaceae bacterium]|nr:DUF4386 domain-containing protein [Pyrinomonadaceae bacterium]